MLRPVLVACTAALLVTGCRAEPSPEPDPPPPTTVEEPASDLGQHTADPAPPSEDAEAVEPDPAPSPLLDDPTFEEWTVPAGTRPHDVAPGLDGRVWYTGQRTGEMGVLDPTTGAIDQIDLGAASAPHGVIVDDAGTVWVTDGGRNEILAIHPDSYEVTAFPLPRTDRANLNTGAFDGAGTHWFTGQAGIHGRVDPASGEVVVFDSPRGAGPYGIATTPAGEVWFSSLAGSYIARILDDDGQVELVDVPTEGGGARRVWSDSQGRLWVTEWFAGNLARYDPASGQWEAWRLPGETPRPYAVYVDDADLVWVTDFGADSLVRFDPTDESFRSFAWPTPGAEVRQLLGRTGEVWGAGSGTDTIIVLRTR
jgi:virginiamycin B lyase